jgi:hypothetical protein
MYVSLPGDRYLSRHSGAMVQFSRVLPSSSSGSLSTFLEDSYGFVDASTGVDYLYNEGLPMDKQITRSRRRRSPALS